MNRALTISYKALHVYRERIFWFLIVSILLVAGSYAFLLQKAIENVVQREKISEEIDIVSTRVGDLEIEYISLKNGINLEVARGRGFRDAVVTSYIGKKSVTAMAPQ